MKLPSLKTALFAALALPAAAQTLQPELEQRYQSGQYAITLSGSPADQYSGVDLRQGPGDTWIFDFCADFSAGFNESEYYDVSTGFGGLTFDQSEAISALLYNTLPVFNGMVREAISLSGDDWPDSSYAGYNDLLSYAAGMQLALWEIIHDPTSGDLDTGLFSVGAVADPDIAVGRSNAQAFLDGVAGGWTYQPGFTFQYARPIDSGDERGQDRLWVAVPEPSSVLLGAFGMIALLRRRRA